jgi:predicted nucleotide-binding protein (sugar kinase/HSP70/actin superfamily)
MSVRPAFNRSVASIGLAAVTNEMTPDEPETLDEATVLEQFAAPATLPLPDYVAHIADATRVGMLSAQAVVMEFEATAKEIEKLGEELKEAQRRSEAGQAVLKDALANLTETAKAYREEAARVFKHIEETTTKASEATALCQELRSKIMQVAS